jgi:hypothetical protein
MHTLSFAQLHSVFFCIQCLAAALRCAMAADAPPFIVVDSEGESESESEGRPRGDYDIDGNLIMHPNEDFPDAHHQPLAPDDPDDDPGEAGRTPADVLCTCANHKVRCVRA